MAGEFSHVKNNEGSTEENFLTDTGVDWAEFRRPRIRIATLSLACERVASLGKEWNENVRRRHKGLVQNKNRNRQHHTLNRLQLWSNTWQLLYRYVFYVLRYLLTRYTDRRVYEFDTRTDRQQLTTTPRAGGSTVNTTSSCSVLIGWSASQSCACSYQSLSRHVTHAALL